MQVSWRVLVCFLFPLFFQEPAAASKEMFAAIDSFVGKVEIQKSGQQQWRQAALGAELHNNDIVRALDKSFIRLSWPDGSISFVRANSQILVNFFESREPDIVSTHITVLYGAVFFVIKEILPRAFFKSYDTKVYTPTAVVSVRGTGFSVNVDAKNGSTCVGVVNGTVLTRNILKDVSSFTSAGFKTVVKLKTDPITPVVLLDKDIADLKTWVPAWVIDKEMAAQTEKAKRDHQILSGDFKDKIVIMPFVNLSRYNGPWNISRGFAQYLMEQLKLSNKNAVISGIDSSVPNPVKIGEKEKARFVIVGNIEDFDVVQHAEISASADEYKEFYIAKVRLHIQLVDVVEKKIGFNNAFVGETRGKNVKDNSWQKIATLPFNLNNPAFLKSILGLSTQQSLDQAGEKIVQWTNLE